MEYLMTRAGADAQLRRIATLEQKLRACLKEKGYAAEVGGNVWHDNFAFEEAQRQEQMLAYEIRRAREVLAGARIVDVPNDPQIMTLGCTANVSIDSREARMITIVGYGEADPDNGRIAYNSPLGQCLLGAKAGDIRTYKVGDREFEVAVLEFCRQHAERCSNAEAPTGEH